MKYSVCLPAVFGGMKTKEALHAVRETGFDRYEFWGWWDLDLDTYAAAQEKEKLQLTTMCTRMIPLNDPECREDYVNGLRETAEVCRRFGCDRIISQTGQERSDVPREVQHQAIVDGLKACIPVLREYDLTLMVEPLNTKIDHKGYYLWSSEEAFQIIEEVGDEHVKVLYDLYHQHIMDDLDVEKIIQNIDKIGHFHVAGYPGRHEPMQDSEIDYPKILEAIRKSGYQHSIGLEYFPVHDAKEGLKYLKQVL